MRKYFLAILTVFMLLSCKEQLISTPEHLLSEDKMEDILYDLAIMDAIKGSHPHVLRNRQIEIMELIYRKHEIDSLQFATSDRYYASKPAIYEKIYKQVEDRLEESRLYWDSITQVRDTVEDPSKKGLTKKPEIKGGTKPVKN
jgi:hypothetical protein